MDGFKEFIKNFMLFISLFYLTFYIPMTFTTYSASWYKFVCNFHERCERIGVRNSHEKIDELTDNFLHSGSLTKGWTNKEKLRLKEVRVIFDKMAILAIIAFIIIVVSRKKVKAFRKFSKINIFIILCFFIVIPFFGKFWKDIFHPLLFNNNLWLNNKFDVSYYIMPRKFFKITVGSIFAAWLAINFATYFYCKRANKN